MPEWMNLKLESTLPGEITTSDGQRSVEELKSLLMRESEKLA